MPLDSFLFMIIKLRGLLMLNMLIYNLDHDDSWNLCQSFVAILPFYSYIVHDYPCIASEMNENHW